MLKHLRVFTHPSPSCETEEDACMRARTYVCMYSLGNMLVRVDVSDKPHGMF